MDARCPVVVAQYSIRGEPNDQNGGDRCEQRDHIFRALYPCATFAELRSCTAVHISKAGPDRLHGAEPIRPPSRWTSQGAGQPDREGAWAVVGGSLGRAPTEGVQQPVRRRIRGPSPRQDHGGTSFHRAVHALARRR